MKRITAKSWKSLTGRYKVEDVALLGLVDTTPPLPGMRLVGYEWSYPTGGTRLFMVGQDVVHVDDPPVDLRPVWVVDGKRLEVASEREDFQIECQRPGRKQWVYLNFTGANPGTLAGLVEGLAKQRSRTSEPGSEVAGWKFRGVRRRQVILRGPWTDVESEPEVASLLDSLTERAEQS